MVRIEGVEPTHLTALDPKSSVSTSSTISAYNFRAFNNSCCKMECKYSRSFFKCNTFIKKNQKIFRCGFTLNLCPRYFYLCRGMKKLVFWMFVLCLGSSNVGYCQLIPDFKSAILLSDAINSSANETKPVFSANGREVYFVRAYHPANVGYKEIKQNQDIWRSVKNRKGEWMTSVNIEKLNNETDNAIIEISEKGKYFIQTSDKVKHHLVSIISEVAFVDDEWTEPKRINFPVIDHVGDFTDFYLTPDGNTLIISMVSGDNNQFEDLFVCHKKDNKWKEVINLGNIINTNGYEYAPFLSKNKNFLYFSTNGRSDGFGQGDVYVSERLDDSWQNWSEPKNLGNIVNSPQMDGYFTISSEGKYYVSSNRGENGDFDIYELSEEIMEEKKIEDELIMEGYVKDQKTIPIMASILLTNTEGGDPVEISSNRMGFYSIRLRKGMKYKMEVLRPGYQNYEEKVIMPSIKDEIDEYWHHITLLKYEKGVKIKLDNLYFRTSTSILKNTSKYPLEKLYEILKDNPEIKIQIEGHTDNIGSESANLELSKERAEVVKNKLIEWGIKKGRIKIRGYGSSLPLVDNTTEENREKNRRVEFVVID